MRRPTLLILASTLAATQAAAQRRVILYVGDGVGVAYWTAARFVADNLAVNQFRVVGLVDTRASDSPITDSAAGATAYASGVRTFNGAIGVGPDSMPVETVLEVAKSRGWATGLVATSSITHATPAAFASHVPSRASQFDIARQMAAFGADVMLGGGTRWFSPATRPDRANLLRQLDSTHAFVATAASFGAIRADTTSRLLGLFGEDQMPPALSRTPTLPAMTRKAIEILSRDPDGFFLVVEGSQADWRGHDNEPIEAVAAEMLDFDAAIRVGLEYQRRVPDALVVVVADHETGGLAIEPRVSEVVSSAGSGLAAALQRLARALGLGSEPDSTLPPGAATPMPPPPPGAGLERVVADYTTGGHTATMVPLFAAGPGAEQFGGIIDNYRVGELLLEAVRRPPPRRRP